MAERSAVEVGVVGCGAIAQLVHIPNLVELPTVSVAAVCDENRPKAQLVAERFEVPAVYSSVEEMIEHPGLDAVIVCTPNQLHSEHTGLALQAGKSVLCERPLGTSKAEVSETLKLAEGAGKTLMGLHFIFSGAAHGEPGVVASLQENPVQLEKVAGGFG